MGPVHSSRIKRLVYIFALTARLLHDELISRESTLQQLSVGSIDTERLFWTTVIRKTLSPRGIQYEKAGDAPQPFHIMGVTLSPPPGYLREL